VTTFIDEARASVLTPIAFIHASAENRGSAKCPGRRGSAEAPDKRGVAFRTAPLVNQPAIERRFTMYAVAQKVTIYDWIRKFVVNRLLYMVLLTVLCLGIFPFCTLYPFTMWVGRTWDSISSTKTHAKMIEAIWDVIGKPYDYLVKLVG
jgi:hypothetical protein